MEHSALQELQQLEDQLNLLVNILQDLQQKNQQLEHALAETATKLEKKHEIARTWHEKYEALKSAQGMNSGDTHAKKRALHHIDALINEVDACISQLEIED
jgi:phage shock protein A